VSTTHFDIAMDKIRRAVQEYEDDWRKGLANGEEAHDNEIAELKQEVERLTKENEKLAHWSDRCKDASDRAFKAEQECNDLRAKMERMMSANVELNEVSGKMCEELVKLRERHAEVAKEHEELLDRVISTATLSERLDWIEKRLAESGFKL